MAASTDACSDARITVKIVTTPTPIISAVAGAEVRRGWRIALRRASDPVTPRSRASGAPSTSVGRPGGHRAEQARSR